MQDNQEAIILVGKLARMIADLQRDRLTLALRLYGESDDTFSPETAEVMSRMRPICEKALRCHD